MKRLIHTLLTAFVLYSNASILWTAEQTADTTITDEAGVLSAEQHMELATVLAAHNKNGPGRISVLIIDKLPPGKTIESLARERINQPRIAAGEKAGRILLAIALQDRKMRIETSKDVWAILPDSFCKRVIDENIAPHFKQKNYFQGLKAGISKLSKKLKGQTDCD